MTNLFDTPPGEESIRDAFARIGIQPMPTVEAMAGMTDQAATLLVIQRAVAARLQPIAA